MTVYMTESDIALLNKKVIGRYSPKEEVRIISPSAFNMIVNLPEQYVFGKPLYPTIFDRVAIFYIQLVKKYVFANANKRTAYLALVNFLWLNGYRFSVENKDAEDRTVNIAVQPLTDALLKECKDWIEQHCQRY